MINTATLHGSVHSKLSGGKREDISIVMDSGCSKDIISEDTVHALGTGDKLNIVGTGTFFHENSGDWTNKEGDRSSRT